MKLVQQREIDRQVKFSFKQRIHFEQKLLKICLVSVLTKVLFWALNDWR
jgi:hypothetical protein